MTELVFMSGLAASLLALTHIFANKLKFLQEIPRSKWLSAAGGVSVAYVFIHILPELQEWQSKFEEQYELSFLQHHLYLVALLGLALFYSIERAAKLSTQSKRNIPKEAEGSYPGIYWLHIISFSVYNLLIGYLLIHRDRGGFISLLLFAIAMALHFLVNDFGLYDHYKRRYTQNGRWIVSVSILVGWVIGLLTEISESGLAIIFAFIAGGIILNVLKEELPEERKSNFWAFFAGILVYSILLISI